jgi:hypothetical protein
MGCAGSKDGKEPKSKNPPKEKSESNAPSTDKKASPIVGGKAIKEIAENELKKHKVSDIMGFVKSGNLPMVHGLIKYYKIDQNVILLRGCNDEFAMSKTQKVSMKEWNPMLVAIAFKKIDIVRYFMQQLKLSLKWANFKGENEETEQEGYGLMLAIANKDSVMLQELWNI